MYDRKGPKKHAARSAVGVSWLLLLGCFPLRVVVAPGVPGTPRPKRVAVTRFRPMVYGRDESQERRGLADEVTIGCEDGLESAGITIVDPVRVAAAMADARVAFPDPTTALGIGKQLDADAVIVGTVNFFKFSQNVDVRLLRVETGATDASSHVDGNGDDRLFGRDACKALVADTPKGQ
jgi:hypothetical protein